MRVIFPRQYTEKEIKRLLSTIEILVDSREKQWEHIKKAYDNQNIKYRVQKLDFADYSFLIPVNEDLDINKDIYFTNHISVERKSSLDELAGNFTKNRTRFQKEFERHEGLMVLMIEGDGYSDICKHNYKSQLKPLSYIASLHSWQHRYNVPFIFIDKQYSAQFIYYTFYYWLRIFMEDKYKI